MFEGSMKQQQQQSRWKKKKKVVGLMLAHLFPAGG
jgi:hypothetical protein